MLSIMIMDPNFKKFIRMGRKFSKPKIQKIKEKLKDGWYLKDMFKKEVK